MSPQVGPRCGRPLGGGGLATAASLSSHLPEFMMTDAWEGRSTLVGSSRWTKGGGGHITQHNTQRGRGEGRPRHRLERCLPAHPPGKIEIHDDTLRAEREGALRQARFFSQGDPGGARTQHTAHNTQHAELGGGGGGLATDVFLPPHLPTSPTCKFMMTACPQEG
jgi:hypothetical protein